MENNVLEELKNTFLSYDNRLPQKEVMAWILKKINPEDFREVVVQISSYENLTHKQISMSDLNRVLLKWSKHD